MQDRPPTDRRPIAASIQEQLAAAYDQHAPAMYRYALMILADPPAAEDAVQQTFVKLAGMGGRIGELTCRGGYLRTAVRNECYRLIRRRRRQSGPAQEAVLLTPADQAAIDEDERRVVEQALRQLPPLQREVVHMKVYERMTFQRIAEAIGVSVNTAAGRYRYAMEKLRHLLARLGPRER